MGNLIIAMTFRDLKKIVVTSNSRERQITLFSSRLLNLRPDNVHNPSLSQVKGKNDEIQHLKLDKEKLICLYPQAETTRWQRLVRLVFLDYDPSGLRRVQNLSNS